MEIWIIVLSIVAFAQMGLDKYRAVKGKWRISEKSLWLVALCGGAIGSLIAMIVFRHKIRKGSFVVGFTLLALLYSIIIFQIPRYVPFFSIR